MRDPRWLAAISLALAASSSGCQPAKDAEASNLASALRVNTGEAVEVGLPVVRMVKDYEDFTGHTEALKSIQVKSRVTGYLVARHFREGEEVKKGDLLYEVDPRPYQTQVVGARSTVARGEAHLKRTAADYQRASNLFRRGTIGKEEFDLIASNRAEAEASLNASKASLKLAEESLGWAQIRADMDGQISRTLVDPGNMIVQGTTVLTDIVETDKLYVDFDISADSLNNVRGLIDEGFVKQDAGKEVPVLVGLSDTEAQSESESFGYKGRVDFSENKLDAATGTLRIRGIIDNPPPSLLLPGLFVRVRLPIGTEHRAVLVRNDVIGSDQGRSYVWVVRADNVVEFRAVEVGPIFGGNLRAIRSGLAETERIVDDPEGMQKVRAGNMVRPQVRDATKKAARKS